MGKVLVLGHSKPYDFKNDNGASIEGVKISYITARPTIKPGEVGYTPIQVSINPSMLKEFKEIPGIYDVEFEQVSGRNNRPELAIVAFEFVKPADLTALFK